MKALLIREPILTRETNHVTLKGLETLKSTNVEPNEVKCYIYKHYGS